jgi:hypothetical protein
MEKWTRSRNEWVSTAGWNVLARLAETSEVTEAELAGHLKTIESKIHSCENRTRYAMNLALICIGMRSDAMHEKAVAAAKRIGRVEVDHGETGCKTPDAEVYIQKMAARKPAKRTRVTGSRMSAPARRGH